MHRNRTWLLDPIELRTQRNRILPIEGGDGSTLTLDFTTGVLDPRLTFTRASDATFINSSGLVQWANANIVRRSEDCTNWGGAQNILPTADAAIAPNGTQTADQLNLLSTSYRYQVTAANKVIGGQRYTGSIYVRAVSGTAQVNLRIANTADGNNGVAVTQTVGETWTRLQGSFTLASNGTLIDIGLDQRTGIPNAGPGVAANVYVWGLQLQPGGTAGEYLQTTTTENNNTPRFDYDPTTQAPRGLLIEGTATNLAFYSEYINPNSAPWNVYWVVAGSGASVTPVSQTDPANGSAASRCVLGTSAVGRVYQGISTSNGATYTLSFWAKSVSGNTALHFWHYNSATGNYTALNITTSWQRYQVTILGRSGGGFVECGIANLTSNASTVDLWGLQLEAGSGASSYIPTGASTGTRNADKMSMTDISTMQWNQTAGTFALHMDVAAETNTSSFPAFMGMYTATPVRVVRFLLNNSSGTNPRIGNDTWTATPTQILSTLVTRSTAPTAFKFAVSLSNTGQTANQVVNAGSVTTTSGTGTLQTPTRLLWHQDPSALDTEYFPIHIRSMKYWPTALPNAQLQSLTT